MPSWLDLREGGAANAAPSVTTERPNVLIIVLDDQAMGKLEAMPHTRRWFREKGLTFNRHYVSTPLCCPSRSSIFTGQYPHNHGVRLNTDYRNLNAEHTMQAYLHQAGYRTAMAGKYLNATLDSPPYWDRWASMRRGYHNVAFNVDGTERRVPRYSTDFIGKKAVEFLGDFQSVDNEPWFLYLAPFAPHKPAGTGASMSPAWK